MIFDSLFSCVLQKAITDTFEKKTFRPRNFEARKQQITDTLGKNSQCIRNYSCSQHEMHLILRIHRTKMSNVSVMLFE